MNEDDMGDLELYEDEPMTSVRASNFSGNHMVIENMDDFERRRQKRRRKRRKRLERLGKIAVCVCCLGAIAAIVLTIVLTEAAISVATPPAPTVAPTPMPVIVTHKPTEAHPTAKVPEPGMKPPTNAVPTVVAVTSSPTFSIMDNYTIESNADTYIYTNGPSVSKTYGREETFFVQTGIRTDDSIPDSLALLVFDTSAVPPFDKFASSGKRATLKLNHKPLEISDQNREPAPITVSRMPSTLLLVESVSGADFQPANTRDGPSVLVSTDATEVTFDVTDLFFNSDVGDENQFFIMLQTRGQEQEVGDRFYSRESDTPPELILSGLEP